MIPAKVFRSQLKSELLAEEREFWKDAYLRGMNNQNSPESAADQALIEFKIRYRGNETNEELVS